jgi:hypothetical protein
MLHCIVDDIELTEATTAALMERQASITAAGPDDSAGGLDGISSVGTSRTSTAQGNYSAATSRMVSTSGGPTAPLGGSSTTAGNSGEGGRNNGIVSATNALHHPPTAIPGLSAAVAAATASAGASALNSPSAHQIGSGGVPLDPHVAHGLAPLSKSLNSALKDTVAPGVREWGGVRFFCGRPWSMRGLSHLFHVDLKTAKCGDPTTKDRILAWYV